MPMPRKKRSKTINPVDDGTKQASINEYAETREMKIVLKEAKPPKIVLKEIKSDET
ncbi:hypothetical protein MUO83_06225 [Candidatus Bathyarchaeota archaeon]|nr:hypothetical protein [Candidatus Bathyarchaeota archaeon]